MQQRQLLTCSLDRRHQSGTSWLLEDRASLPIWTRGAMVRWLPMALPSMAHPSLNWSPITLRKPSQMTGAIMAPSCRLLLRAKVCGLHWQFQEMWAFLSALRRRRREDPLGPLWYRPSSQKIFAAVTSNSKTCQAWSSSLLERVFKVESLELAWVPAENVDEQCLQTRAGVGSR